MKKNLAFGLLGLMLIAGCESPKEDVVAKDYVLLVHNVSSMGCSFVGVDAAIKEYGLEKMTVLYHEDADNTINCDDYNHELDKTCWVSHLNGSGTGTGDHACALGIDEADEPDTTNEVKVKEQKYVAIIPHVSSLACTKGGIDKVLEDHGYGGTQYKFTQEKADIECSSFPGTTCQELNGLDEDEAGYSKNLSCVIGTEDKPLQEKQ